MQQPAEIMTFRTQLPLVPQALKYWVNDPVECIPISGRNVI